MSEPELVAKSGLNRKLVRAIVTGNYTPSPAHRERLAAALGVALDVNVLVAELVGVTLNEGVFVGLGVLVGVFVPVGVLVYVAPYVGVGRLEHAEAGSATTSVSGEHDLPPVGL